MKKNTKQKLSQKAVQSNFVIKLKSKEQKQLQSVWTNVYIQVWKWSISLEMKMTWLNPSDVTHLLSTFPKVLNPYL